jgi:putative tricarboxylic transport membrane protein
LIAAYLVANVIMFVLMTVSVKHLARVINFNRAYLLPAIFVFCLVGAYSLTNRMFDVWVVLGFGVVGFLLDRAKVPLGPFVIGFVLAGPMEAELRSGLQLSQGSLMPLLTRPIALSFLTVTLFTLLFPIVSDQLKKMRRKTAPAVEAIDAND